MINTLVIIFSITAITIPIIIICIRLNVLICTLDRQLSSIVNELKNDKQYVRITQESTDKQWKQKTVVQPSPEEIAPSLRSPPRPQGGFGTKIK